MVATVNLVLEPMAWWHTSDSEFRPSRCSGQQRRDAMRCGRRSAQPPLDRQHFLHFLLIVKLASEFHLTQTASRSFVFLFSQTYKLEITSSSQREDAPCASDSRSPSEEGRKTVNTGQCRNSGLAVVIAIGSNRRKTRAFLIHDEF